MPPTNLDLPTRAAEDLDGDGYLDLVAVDGGSFGIDPAVQIFFSNRSGGFNPPVSVAAPPGPRSIAVGDLDGDGDVDMVTGHDDSYAVFLNDGTGAFSEPQETDAFARIVLLANFRGGSLPDLATTNSSQLQIHSNNGDGTFELHEQNTTDTIWQMVAADVAGSVEPDLVAINWSSLTIRIWVNDGDGVLDGQPQIDPVNDIRMVAASDIDKDNDQDLVMISQSPDLVSVTLNDGAGNFGSPTSHPIDINPRAVLAVELGGSDADDVVIAFDNGRHPVWVLPNDGTGNLGAADVYNVHYTGVGPRALLAADFNNDGAPDILTDNGEKATVLMNRDDSDSKLFAFDGYTVTTYNTLGVAAADFNIDGYPDIAVSLEYSGLDDGSFDGVGLFFNNRDGTFGAQVDIPLVDGDIKTVTAAHLNDDRAPDLVMIRSQVPDEVVVMLNNGDGSFGGAAYYPIGDTGSLDPRSAPDIADFDGDGSLDIAVTNFSDDTVSVLINQGPGTFATPLTTDVFNEPSHSTAADFNSDGLPDLAITTGDLPGEVKLYLNDVTKPGTFLPGSSFALGDFPPDDLESGDFNADGHADLALPESDFDGSHVWVLLGDNNGNFQASVKYAVDSEPVDLAIGDLNGDQMPDLLTANGSAGNLSLMLNQGDGTFAPAVHYHTGSVFLGVNRLALANFDRDELDALDVVVAGKNPDSEPVLTVLPNIRGVELDEFVFCSHSPLLVNPGDDVEITARAKSYRGGDYLSTGPAPSEVEIFVDKTEPVEVGLEKSTITHLNENVDAGSFTYACRVTDGPVEVFSGWRRVAVGPHSNIRAIPVIYTGDIDKRIDIVFFADSDDFSSHEDPAFLTAVGDLIDRGLWKRGWFNRHQQWFNFWIAPDLADGFRESDTSDENKGINKPDNWDTDYGFARARSVVHSEEFRDFSRSGGFTIEVGAFLTFAHELGHREFGLADEYSGDGGYFESKAPGSNEVLLPNLHSTLAGCEEDAPFLGRPASDCYSITGDDDEWYKSDPDTNDLMKDNRKARAADLRRLDWVIDRCKAGDC